MMVLPSLSHRYVTVTSDGDQVPAVALNFLPTRFFPAIFGLSVLLMVPFITGAVGSEVAELVV